MSAHLRMLAERLAALPEFNHHTIEEAVRGLANVLAVKPGVLMNPARVALTGQSVAPGLLDVMFCSVAKRRSSASGWKGART